MLHRHSYPSISIIFTLGIGSLLTRLLRDDAIKNTFVSVCILFFGTFTETSYKNLEGRCCICKISCKRLYLYGRLRRHLGIF